MTYLCHKQLPLTSWPEWKLEFRQGSARLQLCSFMLCICTVLHLPVGLRCSMHSRNVGFHGSATRFLYMHMQHDVHTKQSFESSSVLNVSTYNHKSAPKQQEVLLSSTGIITLLQLWQWVHAVVIECVLKCSRWCKRLSCASYFVLRHGLTFITQQNMLAFLLDSQKIMHQLSLILYRQSL